MNAAQREVSPTWGWFVADSYRRSNAKANTMVCVWIDVNEIHIASLSMFRPWISPSSIYREVFHITDKPFVSSPIIMDVSSRPSVVRFS
jgi:hypothetical protein